MDLERIAQCFSTAFVFVRRRQSRQQQTCPGVSHTEQFFAHCMQQTVERDVIGQPPTIDREERRPASLSRKRRKSVPEVGRTWSDFGRWPTRPPGGACRQNVGAILPGPPKPLQRADHVSGAWGCPERLLRVAAPADLRAQEDARLLRLIRASFTASQGIYGAPRVFLDLREAGQTCSKHRIARLMREANLRALHGYRTRRWSVGKPSVLIANLQQRQFTVTRATRCGSQISPISGRGRAGSIWPSSRRPASAVHAAGTYSRAQ
jgi:hypothetical protein